MASNARSPGSAVKGAEPASRHAASWRARSHSLATSSLPAAATATAARLPPSSPTSRTTTCFPDPSAA
eukprot:1360563-Alexandrium_andersonii.AAC.1